MQTTIEQVNSPAHYNQGPLECIDAIQAALTPDEFVGFLKGQQLKYVWRAGHKESSDILTDIRKSQWYGKKLLSFVEEQRHHDAMTTVVAFHNEATKEEKPEWWNRYVN